MLEAERQAVSCSHLNDGYLEAPNGAWCAENRGA